MYMHMLRITLSGSVILGGYGLPKDTISSSPIDSAEGWILSY